MLEKPLSICMAQSDAPLLSVYSRGAELHFSKRGIFLAAGLPIQGLRLTAIFLINFGQIFIEQGVYRARFF